MGRTKPYTEAGIKRVRCAHCKIRRAQLQWSTACANGNRWVALCLPCDVELNHIVLSWIGDPDVDDKIHGYKLRMIRELSKES